MPVELWIGQEFKTTHERRAFDQFRKDMEAKFGQSKQLHFILVNYSLDGREIDLTVLKRDAIIVVELKECADPIETSENGDWLTIPGNKIIGTGDQNPYQQAKDYRIKWANFLKRNEGKFLARAKISTMDFMHTSAFVAISPALPSNTKNNIPAHLPWFRLVGLDKLSQAIGQQTSRSLNFSDQELRSLVTDILHLKKFDPNISSGMEAINTHWLEYCHTLLTTHRDWTAMPPALYLSPEQMDIAPARVILDKEQFTEVKLQFISGFKSTTIKRLARKILDSDTDETKDLLTLIDEAHRPVVLLGSPGLGKSVAMEHLALKYAERYAQNKADYVPVLIRLRNHSQRRSLNYLIRVTLQSNGVALSESEAARILQTEKLLLLFDGLDEAPNASDIVPELETFLQEYPHHHCVISSRLNVYRANRFPIIGCYEVELQGLTHESAAKLWQSFVGTPNFGDLPETVQHILRTPLFLRLYAENAQLAQIEVKTEAQLMDLIVRKCPESLKPPRESREVVDRCLFQLALEESFIFNEQCVFRVVANSLPGESTEYQQKIANILIHQHPLLISFNDYISFWHPAFKDYFAARGLQDIIRNQDFELALSYFNIPRWDETIVYLAQISDSTGQARLIEYILENFDNPILAWRCVGQAPSLHTDVIDKFTHRLAQGLVTAIENIQQNHVEQVDELLQWVLMDGNDSLRRAWSNSDDKGDLSKVENLNFYLGLNKYKQMSKLEEYFYILVMTIRKFELEDEIYLEPYFLDLLKSPGPITRLIGWSLLKKSLDFLKITFSMHFLKEIAALIMGEAPPQNSMSPTDKFLNEVIKNINFIEMLTELRIAPKILALGEEKQKVLSFWRNILYTGNGFSQIGAALGLLEIGGDEALELLCSLLDHPEPSLRYLAIFGIIRTKQSNRYNDLRKMIYDPDPVVAFWSTFQLESVETSLSIARSGAELRLVVENLLMPLTNKFTLDILSKHTLLFGLNSPYMPIELFGNFTNFAMADPLLDVIGSALICEGVCFDDYFLNSPEWHNKKAGWQGAVIALIWTLSLAISGRTSFPRSEITPEEAKETLARILTVTKGWFPFYDEKDLGKPLELTDNNIAYIKSWTDHDLTREIAEEVLAGRYRPRLKE
ncbi:MAG: hypothetical protein BroJett011_21620 [Chloroflexota bacterium]|nr:MAG: hypothetical protein BroJett011_21620 [Chloroflexota bacterium]